MKNLLTKSLCLLLLFSTFLSFTLKAEEVVLTDIKKIAHKAFLALSGRMQEDVKIAEIVPILHQDTALFYIINFDCGFIILAADDVSKPIIGFDFETKFDIDNTPPALKSLFEDYKQEILHAKRLKLKASQEIREQWDGLLSNSVVPVIEEQLPPEISADPTKIYTPGTYLIETQWNQSGLGKAGSVFEYNFFCPIDKKSGKKTLVGCGGVALAQILNYYSCNVIPQELLAYKPQGLDSIKINFSNQSYDWEKMLPKISTLENAKLLYHSAAAIKSSFGVNSTGSIITDVPTAFCKYFGLSWGAIWMKEQKSNYSKKLKKCIKIMMNNNLMKYP